MFMYGVLRCRFLLCKVIKQAFLLVLLLLFKCLYRGLRRVLRSRKPSPASGVDDFCTNEEVGWRFMYSTTQKIPAEQS